MPPPMTPIIAPLIFFAPVRQPDGQPVHRARRRLIRLPDRDVHPCHLLQFPIAKIDSQPGHVRFVAYRETLVVHREIDDLRRPAARSDERRSAEEISRRGFMRMS